MVICVWLSTMICLIILIGEIRHRFLNKKDTPCKKTVFFRNWLESIDVDIEGLVMEQAESGFVSMQTLGKRGSWRLAQDKIMGISTFEELREEEYCRRL